MRIACLHTAESNIAVFASACREPNVRLQHAMRPDLLAAAERAGTLTRAIATETIAELAVLAEASDAVLLTCSTLGPAVMEMATSSPVPILRVDGALAQAAARVGGRIVVLCAAETTIAPTRALFEAAIESNAALAICLVPHAWDAFKAGQIERYHAIIAEAADHAYRDGADVVALAQASMAGAAVLCREGQPLTSPAAGLAAAMQAAKTQERDVIGRMP